MSEFKSFDLGPNCTTQPPPTDDEPSTASRYAPDPHQSELSSTDVSWVPASFLPPAEPAPLMESRLRLNAEQRRQLEVLDLSRPVPVPGRRNLTPRVMSIVLVANDLARRDIPVCAATVRAGLVALGECTGDKGNQALGDVLGSWGLDLSRRKRKVQLGGESRTVTAYDVPAGGVSRADLEAKFSIPKGWDWARYAPADDGGHDQGENPPLAATEPEDEDEISRLLRDLSWDDEPCPELQ